MSQRRTIADQGGFTLLEMLIAIAIMAMASVGVGLAFPALQKRAELRQAANSLDRLLAKARDEAVRFNHASSLRFDASRRILELSDQKGSYKAPDHIAVSVVGAASGLRTDAPSIFFLSDGSSSGGVIELRSGELKVVRRIGWLTGRIDRSER